MNDDLYYAPTLASFALGSEQIHVWRINLAPSKSRMAIYEQTLSLDEQERAARFRKVKDRERFILARGSLRAILSHYLETAPQQLRFVYGEQGKPALEIGLHKGLHFNMAHSESLALLAVARDCEVGIDVEAMQTDFDVESIARLYFTPQESAVICAAPVNKKHEIFFTCWSLKEAYSKACGSGLSESFGQLELLPVATPTGTTFEYTTKIEETSRWRSYKLPTLAGYAAALVVEGKRKQVCCWQWKELP